MVWLSISSVSMGFAWCSLSVARVVLGVYQVLPVFSWGCTETCHGFENVFLGGVLGFCFFLCLRVWVVLGFMILSSVFVGLRQCSEGVFMGVLLVFWLTLTSCDCL